MQSINDIASRRVQQLSENQPTSSIEEAVSNSATNSIELPAEIASLNTGSDYWRTAKANRYRKLIREGHLADLLELAKMALGKKSPANWFATAASKAQWERTLTFLAKAREVARTALEVAKRIRVPADKALVVLKACWRLRATALRHAVTAAETTRNGEAFTYFWWLCAKVGDGAYRPSLS